MNGETKRHIDAARQVLVGVVPNPTSQIDQITNALIYKFMDDMDQAAIKAGGKPSFFVGDLEKYAWTRLMDSKIGSQERMNLYAEGFIKLSESKKIPELFRSILKSAYLPYRSPEVLDLFLREINYFDYSHPEELGNAYEYLLSIMSSQGDAGQFRTPRHIIDFIVAAVNPTKDEKILDPACGTAGFLISAYRHILSRHDGSKGKEKPLTPDQRRNLMSNFEGYDIDPGMVRISQVNMYLHQFKDPKIFQYDSLSSDERWGDKFDVILANPPFMSPKGGIRPHSKFAVQSNRSEVLFVDYIMSHLRPKGRAGIIVPEGIIFQSGTAYKQLRKNLIEDGLSAVVSLPSGVFNPYAGVKTSVLFFDNDQARKKDEILFIKISNDGFDLGATKRPIDKNDLPEALEILNKWHNGEKSSNKIASYVSREKIAEGGEYNLSADRYSVSIDYSNAKWPIVKLGSLIEFEKKSKRKSGDGKDAGIFKFFVSSQIQNKFIDVADYPQENLILGTGGNASVHIAENFSTSADTFVFHSNNKEFLNKYLYFLLYTNKEILEAGFRGQGIKHLSKEYLVNIKTPQPPLEIQKQIVEELDSYQKIVSGAQQVVENWKPRIDIDSRWEKVKIGDVCLVERGGSPRPIEKYITNNDNGVNWIKIGDTKNVEKYIYKTAEKIIPEGIKKSRKVNVGDFILSNSMSFGRPYIMKTEGYIHDGWLRLSEDKKRIDKDFMYYVLLSDIVFAQFEKAATGGVVRNLNSELVRHVEIPLPSLEIQKEIVKRIESEHSLVESNKKLIKIYDKKIKEVIAKLWKK